MTPIDLKDCSFFILDKDGSNFINIRIGEGNFTYSIERSLELKKSRGNLDKVREGEEEPVKIQFQFVWDQITSSGMEAATVEEALNKLGPASNWQSAASDSLA